MTVGEGTAGTGGLPAGVEATQRTDPKWRGGGLRTAGPRGLPPEIAPPQRTDTKGSVRPLRTAEPNSNSAEGRPPATKQLVNAPRSRAKRQRPRLVDSHRLPPSSSRAELTLSSPSPPA